MRRRANDYGGCAANCRLAAGRLYECVIRRTADARRYAVAAASRCVGARTTTAAGWRTASLRPRVSTRVRNTLNGRRETMRCCRGRSGRERLQQIPVQRSAPSAGRLIEGASTPTRGDTQLSLLSRRSGHEQVQHTAHCTESTHFKHFRKTKK